MMRPPNSYIYLIFGASVLLIIINIEIQPRNNAYYATSANNGKNIRIVIQVEHEEDKLNVIKLNDDMTDSTYMKNNLIDADNDKHSKTSIKNILTKERTKIKGDLFKYYYNWTLSGVNDLKDLVMESGGQPLRSLIISSWRSGSTFLGDFVNSVPSSFYNYEPLLMYGIKQIMEPRELSRTLKMVKQMFKCNFYDLEDFFQFERKDVCLQLFNHKTRLFDYCKDGNNNELCFNEEYRSRFCKLFPFQNMKLVRLRLKFVEEILDDKELNVKVILLVRDPRGMLQSRRHRGFCVASSDCIEPPIVCSDLVSDYMAAKAILQKYPNRLLVIRFEDLALKPYITADKIVQFLKVDGKRAFEKFLQSHTNVEVDGPHSTVKVSRNIPFKWKTALDFSYVDEIQMACKEAMRLWGYKMAHNETHMKSKDFYPIEGYKII